MNEPEISVELQINGKPVELNEFVHKIVGNLLLAIIKSLRLTQEPKSAAFNVRLD